MASVSFTIPAPDSPTTDSRRWFNVFSGLLIPGTLLANTSDTAYLRFMFLRWNQSNQQFRLDSVDSGSGSGSGPEMSSAWESSAVALTISDGTNSLTVKGPSHPDSSPSDDDEPYSWNVPSADQMAIEAFFNSYDGTSDLTLTLDDGLRDYEVNPDDAAFAFRATQPEVLRARTHAIAAGDAAFAFETVDPDTDVFQHFQAFFEFDSPEPEVTYTERIPDITSLIAAPLPRFPVVNVDEAAEVLLPQYENSTRLQALVAGLIAVARDTIVDPLKAFERALNPDVSEGVLLDWIGVRLGISRPFVTSADALFLGFEGTMASGGRPFSQAPFFTRQRGIELVDPIGDATYRLILKARARRLRGGADRETLEAVLKILFNSGYVDESGIAPVLRADVDDDVLYGLVSDELFESLFPRPAGTPLTLVRN